MKMCLKNYQIELEKYKSMLLTCKSDNDLKFYIEKEIKRIKNEIDFLKTKNKKGVKK